MGGFIADDTADLTMLTNHPFITSAFTISVILDSWLLAEPDCSVYSISMSKPFFAVCRRLIHQRCKECCLKLLRQSESASGDATHRENASLRGSTDFRSLYWRRADHCGENATHIHTGGVCMLLSKFEMIFHGKKKQIRATLSSHYRLCCTLIHLRRRTRNDVDWT